MPYEFFFKNNEEDVSFKCNLQCKRCEYINHETNQRCKRTSCIGFEYCWQHTIKEKKLKIKKSSIHNAGKGLFAWDPTEDANAIIFRKGDTIIQYKGETITPQQLDQRYGVDGIAPYGIRVSRPRVHHIDSACLRGIASLINHKRRSDTNVEFSQTGNVVAKKTIRNKQELFVFYGGDYNLNEIGDKYTYKTRTKK